MLHISLGRLACPIVATGFAVLATSLAAAGPAAAATHPADTHQVRAQSPAAATVRQTEESAPPATIGSHAVAVPANYPDAWLSKTQFLAANPIGDPPSCTLRDITLNPGTYTWRIFMGPNTQAGQDFVQLDKATYVWTICLYPKNGAYDEESWFGAGSDYIYNANVKVADGTYNWGSVLIPHF